MAQTLRDALLAFGLLAATPAAAVTVKLAPTGGLMQQPTSHYYLAVYGAKADVATNDDHAILRVSYVERPAFRSVGFIDQESGLFAQIGTKVTHSSSDHGLYAFFGGGRMQGYVKVDPDVDPAAVTSSDVTHRSFSMPGLTASIEYALRWRGLDMTVNHQTFIGYVDDAQLEAYVAWPYNFFQVSVGYAW